MKIAQPYIFILVLLFVAFNHATAQLDGYPIALLSPELTKNANEVVRLDQSHFVINNEKSASLKIKYVVTLLNSKSDEDTQVVFYNKNSKISQLSAKVYDAFGKEVRKVKKKDFSDQSAISNGTMYSDSRVKVAELNHNQYPYTIVLEYTKTFKKTPFFRTGRLQSYKRAIEKFEYRIDTPKDLEIRYKSKNIDLEPQIKKLEKKTVYTWSASQLAALEYEPFAPYYEKIQPAILIAPTKFVFDGHEGDMSTWESFGKFMYDINKTQDQLTPTMAEKVQDLIAGVSTNKEKIEILYRYLQENSRYVSVQLGIGGWQSFDAEYVEKNKYGDCKALSNFMKSMLNEAGIESHWALIYRSNRYKKEMDQELVTPGSANHMILNIPQEDIWLECTSSDYPINYLGGSNENRQALLITEQGGKITQTPNYGLDQNKSSSTATIKVNADGAAMINNTTTYVGPEHDYYRYIGSDYSQSELEKEFLRELDLPAFTIDALTVKNEKDAPVSTRDYQINVRRYASKAGRRIFIPLNKLNPFGYVPKDLEKRIHPVHVKRQYKEEDHYTFELSGDYEIESIPRETIDLKSEFGSYQVSITVEEQKVTYHRVLEIYSVELPAERYNDLRNFYKEIAKADNMKIVLVKRKA